MNNPLPQRKSPRLQGYDYRQSGAYFVTICTYERAHLFGDVVDGNMCLNPLGVIADQTWHTLPDHHPHVELDAFVVMPNHVHGILLLVADAAPSGVGTRRASSETPASARPAGTPRQSLGAAVGAYKSAVTRAINQTLGLTAPLVWQARYHDHIIRDEAALNRIRDYVYNNPAMWAMDEFFNG